MEDEIRVAAFQSLIAMFLSPNEEIYEMFRQKGKKALKQLIGSIDDEKEFYINHLYDAEICDINNSLISASLGERYMRANMCALNMTDLFSYFASDELRNDYSFKQEMIMKNPICSYGMAMNNLLNEKLFLIAYKLLVLEGIDPNELISLLDPSFKGTAVKILLGLKKSEIKKVDKDLDLLDSIEESVLILENKNMSSK